jgi:predicted DNA-binding transcriptional regulator YafY
VRAAHRTAQVAQVVGAVRAGDRAAPPDSAPTVPAAALSHSGSLTALREAVETGTTVVISYVDNHGTRSDRVVDPRRVEGGWLTAHDQRSDDERTFAVHRITAVRPLDAS